jgi:hypothetical protein
VPLVRALAGSSGPTRVVAVESGKPAEGQDPEIRAEFIGPLRGISDVNNRVSTVNNIEDWRGRVATVLAVSDLAIGRVGHYGVGSGADRLSPESG